MLRSPPQTQGHADDPLYCEVSIDGKRHSWTREAAIELASPVLIGPPVKGIWSYENGPGELAFHFHYRLPQRRYAYDIVMRRDIRKGRATFDGDPVKNESYFDWHQPIHAVADGTVIEVIDNSRERNGNTADPAKQPCDWTRIVVEHADKKRSLYGSVGQGTAVVKVGEQVKTGQRLGHVGNTGEILQPHLHFELTELDATGRQRALPVRFRGLKARNGSQVSGVPKGGQEYRTP
jgi:Peptidase family M23